MGGESRSEATTAYSRQPEISPGKPFVIDPLWSYHHIAAERDICDLQGGNFICIDGMEFSGPGNETHTIPTNLDFEAFHERRYHIGEYAINGGRLAYLDQYGRKFLGFATYENIKALEQANYKKGRVWVEFSHGEEPVRQEDKQKFRSWEAKEHAQKLEPFILQGLELMTEGEFREAVDYFEDPKLAKAVGFDWGDARTMIIGPSPGDQQVQEAIDFCANNSHFDPLLKGRPEKPLITLANVTIRPKDDNPSARLYHNIALLHAEEWLHGLIFLRKKPLNEGLKIKDRRYSRTAEEVDIVLYLQKHNVPMTDEFLDRYGRREELGIPKAPETNSHPDQRPITSEVQEATQEETKPDMVGQGTLRKTTRRTALKALAAEAGTIALGGGVKQILDSPHEPVLDKLRESILRRTIEDEFNIVLQARIEIDGPELSSTSWNLERLKTLKEALSSLPRHFYSTEGNNKKLTIILESYETSCDCDGEDQSKPLKIHIGTEFLESVETALPILAHELTHAIMPMKGPNRHIGGEGHLVITSPWFDRIYQITGENFLETRKKMAPHLDTDYLNMYKAYVHKKPIIPSVIGLLAPREKERLVFDLEFKHGLFGRVFESRDIPHEFIAVLSQHYVRGRNYFFRMYSRYFSTQEVGNFYNFVRDDIFRGKEY